RIERRLLFPNGRGDDRPFRCLTPVTTVVSPSVRASRPYPRASSLLDLFRNPWTVTETLRRQIPERPKSQQRRRIVTGSGRVREAAAARATLVRAGGDWHRRRRTTIRRAPARKRLRS